MNLRHKTWWGMLALWAGLALVGCSVDDNKESGTTNVPSVNEIYQEGVAKLKHSDVNGAIRYFSLIVENTRPGTPQRPMAQVYLGQIALLAGNSKIAIEKFRAALDEDPTLIPAWQALGNAYFAEKNLTGAIEVWEPLIKQNPNRISIHNNLGVAYMDLGKLDKAIEHLEKSVTLNPDNARTLNNLAQAYRRKGMEDAASVAERKLKSLRERMTQPAQTAAH